MKKHQTYNDGRAYFHKSHSAAGDGRRPDEEPGEQLLSTPYQNRTVGVKRMAIMADLGERVDKLIRVPYNGKVRQITTQTICLTEDGERYWVRQLTDVMSVTPQSADVMLERMELPC